MDRDAARGESVMIEGDDAGVPGVTIRRATAADLGPVLGLLREAGLPAAGVADWFSSFVVAEEAGLVVGSAGIETYGAHALLRSVVVAPAMKGRGVGSGLGRAALDLATAAGACDAWLLTTTAERWFPRLGFRRVAREDVPAGLEASVELREACPASATVMMRPLQLAQD
jgi:N-acetylglutamate synthase-like GNAT family acetyltransferase